MKNFTKNSFIFLFLSFMPIFADSCKSYPEWAFNPQIDENYIGGVGSAIIEHGNHNIAFRIAKAKARADLSLFVKTHVNSELNTKNSKNQGLKYSQTSSILLKDSFVKNTFTCDKNSELFVWVVVKNRS